MNERELRDNLLHLDMNSASTDPRHLTARILMRDRRRVQILTVATLGIWALAAAILLGVYVAFGLFLPRQEKLRQEQRSGAITADEARRMQDAYLEEFQKITFVTTGAVALLAVAALLTTLLILATRRATLRQINANLTEISKQLRALHPSMD